MVKPLIAIDIDDTLADSTELIRLKINERHGLSIPLEAYRTQGDYWGYYERVWAEHGLTTLTSSDLDHELVDDFTTVPLLPSAQFAVNELAKRFEIVIITARNPEWRAMTATWLKENFPNIDIDLHFSEAHRDGTKMTKGQICKHLGASYLIDDNVGHCQSALQADVTPILFGTYGWHSNMPEGLVQCKDWPAVLDYFNEK